MNTYSTIFQNTKPAPVPVQNSPQVQELSWDGLIFIIKMLILVKRHIFIKTSPGLFPIVSSTRNGSRFEYHIRIIFYVEDTNIDGVK